MASTVSFDIAAMYRPQIEDFWNRFSAGLNLSNMGPRVTYIDAAQADPLPTNLRVGVGFKVFEDEYNSLQYSLDFSRLLIKRIIFEGNKAFSGGDLRGLIGTKEEWIFSFLTNRGVLDRDMLTNDVAILSNHYNDHGYVENKVDDPMVLRGRDGLEVVFHHLNFHVATGLRPTRLGATSLAALCHRPSAVFQHLASFCRS